MKRIILLLWLIPFSLSGQRYISGRITDATTDETIPGASVFIAGTTVGTTTDPSGNYRLKIPGEGSYRLTISHVGYQPVFKDIEPGNTSMMFDIALNTNEMEEISIAVKVRFRKKDINLFWKTILGNPPSKKTIYPVNPESVYYYYNSETKILKVTCREPLQIINRETGYHVQLVLGHFSHDYKTNSSRWKTEYMFSELEPENPKQKTLWDKNRMKVYQGSLTNFFKALYHNRLMEKGYLLTYSAKSSLSDSLHNVLYEDPMNFISIDSVDGSKSFYISPDLKDLMLVCFGKPIDQSILDEVNMAQDRKLNWTRISLFRNAIQTPDEPVQIFSDGTYMNLIHLTPYFSASILGINRVLPLDYIPEVDFDVMSLALEEDVENELSERFFQQLNVFPQEKIHLHTDKPYYISGERIWFRAYLVDAATHSPVSNSRYIYVELINPLDTVVARAKILQKEGTYHGHLFIPEEAPEGDYTIRAYTTYMRSLDENYFYTKTIRIGDPQARAVNVETDFTFESGRRERIFATFRFSHVGLDAPLVPKSVKVSVNGGRTMNVKVNEDGTASFNFNLPDASRQRSILLEVVAFTYPYRKFIPIPLPSHDFDVSFYPEGGVLMQGTFSQLAFKAMKSNGQATAISGVVYNQDGTEISKFKTEHLGMGSFRHVSEKGKTYYAVCENDKGESKRFNLPAAVANGYALAVNQARDKIFVSTLKPDTNLLGLEDPVGLVEGTKPVGFEQPNRFDTLYLLAHTRGIVHFVRILDQENHIVVLQKDQFPSGVLHFILFDAGMNPLSERLFFINNPEDQAQVSYQPDRENYARRSLVKNSVILTDIEGEPLTGNFSVAVTSDREVIPDSASNILTSLLLTSDLRGNIENPAYYFQNNNTSMVALDLLMLTQGWRRYNIAELAQGRFALPTLSIEAFPQISGLVERISLYGPSVPREDTEVIVISPEIGYFESTQTDKHGRFYFRGIEFSDSTRFIIQAVLPRSKIGVVVPLKLIIDEDNIPERTLSSVPPAEMDKSQFAKYADKADQMYTLENGVRVYQLSELTITAPQKPPVESFYYVPSFVSQTITAEEIKRIPGIDILQHLSSFAGLCVTRTGDPNNPAIVKIRCTDWFTVTFMVDDMEWKVLDIVDGLSPSFVDQIHIYKGANPFGGRGAGGVVAIYTKRGDDLTDSGKSLHVKEIMPLGYQQPVEFYAPKYDTPEKRNAQMPDLRTTIHWQPVVQTDNTGLASFEFYTADEPTSYTVIIEGLSDDGKIIRREGRLWRRE